MVSLVQSKQTLPQHLPIHLDQKHLFTGLLAVASALSIGKMPFNLSKNSAAGV
jgi:hypothetical protein